MIVVAGTISIKADKREEAIRVAADMATATRAEAGCRRYAFYADLADPNTFFLFEEWESEAALAAHFQTEHMRVFQQRVPDLLAGPLEVHRYVVESASRMM